MKSQAVWYGRIEQVLEESGRFDRVKGVGYGTFDVFSFWFPFFFRRIPLARIRREIYEAGTDRDAEISVIAHSFGTWIIGQILKEEAQVSFKRIILCGSILKQAYKWDQVFGRRIGKDCILNECGTTDRLPLLAKATSWGYGPSGTYGFHADGVRDRYHNVGHGEFLTPEFARQFWVPWLADGKYERTGWDSARPEFPKWFHVPFAVEAVIKIALLVVFFALFWLAYLLGAWIWTVLVWPTVASANWPPPKEMVSNWEYASDFTPDVLAIEGDASAGERFAWADWLLMHIDSEFPDDKEELWNLYLFEKSHHTFGATYRVPQGKLLAFAFLVRGSGSDTSITPIPLTEQMPNGNRQYAFDIPEPDRGDRLFLAVGGVSEKSPFPQEMFRFVPNQ